MSVLMELAVSNRTFSMDAERAFTLKFHSTFYLQLNLFCRLGIPHSRYSLLKCSYLWERSHVKHTITEIII